MTVETDHTVERHFISGAGPYAFSFRIFAATDLAVTALSAVTPPVSVILTYLTHYTVSGVNDPDGGSIMLTSGAASVFAGYTLDIRSNTPNAQRTRVRNAGRLTPEIQEDAFDHLSRQIQDLKRQLRACVRYPDITLNDGTMAPLSAWLSRFLYVNSIGVVEPAAGVSTTVVTASLITSLLSGSTSQQDALQALLMARSDKSPALDSLRRTAAEIAAGVTPVNYASAPAYARRYGVVGDGVTDDTLAMRRAVEAARAAGGSRCVLLDFGMDVLITDTLVLSSSTLSPVNIIGATPEWFGTTFSSRIQGNFNGPLLNTSGTSTGPAYSVGALVRNIRLENLNTGTSACAIKGDYSGGLRVYDTWIRVNNIGVRSTAEMISPRFYEVNIDSPTLAVACYNVHQRNGLWFGGRAYGARYGFDIRGDDPYLNGVNIEFCQICIRHGAAASILLDNCHFESSQCLLTNAIRPPINISGAWTDAGGNGTGISGCAKFAGGFISFANANTNLVTIKSAGGFTYCIEFDGTVISATNPIVGNSFNPGTSTALPSGTRIAVRNTIGFAVANPPNDAFSAFTYENAEVPGGIDASVLKINGNVLKTYAPTWASSGTQPALGNGTITGSYMQAGNLVVAKIKLTAGSTTTYGTGIYTFGLPIPAAGTMQAISYAVDTGTGKSYGFAQIFGSAINPATAAGAGYSATVPHTWASTDTLELTACYFV